MPASSTHLFFRLEESPDSITEDHDEIIHSHPHSHTEDGHDYHTHGHRQSSAERSRGYHIHGHDHGLEELEHVFHGLSHQPSYVEVKHTDSHVRYKEVPHNYNTKSHDHQLRHTNVRVHAKQLEDNDIENDRIRRTHRREYFPRQYLQKVEHVPHFNSKSERTYKPFLVTKPLSFKTTAPLPVSKPRLQGLSNRHHHTHKSHFRPINRQLHPGSFLEPPQKHHQRVHGGPPVHNGRPFVQKKFVPRIQTHVVQPLVQHQPLYQTGYLQQQRIPKKNTIASPQQYSNHQNQHMQSYRKRHFGANQVRLPLLPPPQLIQNNQFKQPRNNMPLVVPPDKRLAISNWYQQHNQMLKNEPHRQDSVEQGTSFDEDSKEDEDGVLNTNLVWPDVLKSFNHQVIPLRRAETNNLTIDTNDDLSPSVMEDTNDNEDPSDQFTQNTRQKLFNSKASRNNDKSHENEDFEEAALKEDLKSSTEDLEIEDHNGSEMESDDDTSRKYNQKFLLLLSPVI